MPCRRRNDAQIMALAAGGLSPLRRRPLAASPAAAARSAGPNTNKSRALWAGLRGMASAPVPPALTDRVRGAWPLAPMQRMNPMKRRMALLTCALLLAGVSAAMAAHVIGYHPSGGFSHGAQTWSFTTNLKGRLTVLDPQGHKIGQFTDDGAWMTDAAGPDFGVGQDDGRWPAALSSMGRAARRSKTRKARCWATSSSATFRRRKCTGTWAGPAPRATSRKRRSGRKGRTRRRAAGPRASRPRLTGARGFDKALGVSWKMRGYGTIKVTRANGDMMPPRPRPRPPPPSVQASCSRPASLPGPGRCPPEWTADRTGPDRPRDRLRPARSQRRCREDAAGPGGRAALTARR